MKINELIDSHSELTDTAASKSAVVLMTRIRLPGTSRANPFPAGPRKRRSGTSRPMHAKPSRPCRR